MKLIHCADIHMDSAMESNLSSEKARIRRAELFDTFKAMVEYAKENDVRAIIIAGDMFDTKNSQLRIKNRVRDLIAGESSIDFLYLKGNHDNADFLGESEKPENLKLFDDEPLSYTYGNVQITGAEKCGDIYNKLALDENMINIVVLHGQEATGNLTGEGIINLSALASRNIDYLALGHIHSYKCGILDERGVYCYSGCLEGRGFDECGEKGFVLIDINDKGISHEFIPFARRLLHTVPVDLSGAGDDILSRIDSAVAGIPSKDMVKIVLEGETDEQADIETVYITKMYEPRFYFVKVYNHTSARIDYESYKNDISLKGEFVRLVSSQDMDEARKSEIIMTGLRALAGREIDI